MAKRDRDDLAGTFGDPGDFPDGSTGADAGTTESQGQPDPPKAEAHNEPKRLDEAPRPGGKYLVGGQAVDAHGKPIGGEGDRS